MNSATTTDFILFYDLQLNNFYSYSQDKGIIIKEKTPDFFQKIIRQQVKQHHVLIQNQGWAMLNDFQKKPIPRYFLTQRKYKYPVYITQQPMPQALLQQKISPSLQNQKSKTKQMFIDKVNITIFLTNLQDQIEKGKPKKPVPNSLNLGVKLLISANQVIRHVCRMILQDYQVVITTKSGKNKLIFKILGQNQFIYGNEPLIKFQIIRNMIRNQKTTPLKVELIETQVTNKEQFKKFIFQRNASDLQKGIFQPFPWDKLKQQGFGTQNNDPYPTEDKNAFLLWYQPSLVNIDPEKLINDMKNKHSNQSDLQKSYQSLKFKIEMMKRQLQQKVPRYIWKQRIFKFLEHRRQYIKQKLVDLQGSTIYTGQCPFTWNFSITGVLNLKALFRSQGSITKQKESQKMLNQPIIQYRQKGFLKFTSKQVQDGNYPKFMNSPFERNRRFTQVKKKGQYWISPYQVSIVIEFYYNGEKMGDKNKIIQTQPMIANQKFIEFDETFQWIMLSKIMLQTNLIFRLKIHSKEGASLTGGIGVLKLFDQYGYLRQGEQFIQILAIEKLNNNKIGCMDKLFHIKNDQVTMIKIKMPSFKQPVRWSLQDSKCLEMLGYLPQPKKNQQKIEMAEALQKISDILKVHPIRMLKYDAKQKQILKLTRSYYSHQPDKLLNYLIAIDWTDPSDIQQAYTVLKQWKPLNPIQGLMLMSRHLSDQKVRLFAMQALQKMQEHDMILYANQISQALVSFETHQNPLIDWIIEKSCQNPYQIGQQYFWQFRNKISDPIISYRFRMYLQTLVNTSPIRSNFYHQVLTNDRLLLFNNSMIQQAKQWQYAIRKQHFKGKVQHIEKLLRCLDDGLISSKGYNLAGVANLTQRQQGKFIFPINPQNQYDFIEQNDSTVFDSKKMPFCLGCKNSQIQNVASMDSYRIMFKQGDDIKQDHLILQLLKIFDNLWLQAGYNFQMNIYKVLSTGDDIGFIELVEDSVNISKVHDYSKKIFKAFDKQVTLLYLKKNATDQSGKINEDYLNLMKQNFRKSCAGYLVATYILGIADRHSGNIMMQTKTGKMFHIDFGHILGKFKQKMGIKRERTPFIFTVEHAHVLGGSQDSIFERFEKDCADAYNILRRNGNLIIFLMMMLIAADLPQLQSYENIEYMIDKLSLDLSQSHAAQKIIKQIRLNLQSESQRWNNLAHQFMRSK